MVQLSNIFFARDRGTPKIFKRLQLLRTNARFDYRARNCFRIGVRSQMKALQYARTSRKLKKYDYRELWNLRLEAASEENGIPLRNFWESLRDMQVALNRKVLTDLAIYEPRTFSTFCELAKQHQVDKGLNIPLHSKPKIPVITRGMI